MIEYDPYHVWIDEKAYDRPGKESLAEGLVLAVQDLLRRIEKLEKDNETTINR